jgi:3-methyladenine DNA glycosylase AlkC
MPIEAGKPIVASEVNAEFNARERHSNKVTALSASSTDTQYPSAKAVYTGLAAKANASDMTTALAAKENISNKKTSISSTSDTEYPSSKAVATALAAKEDTSNKVTALSETSTAAQYPSAKLVYDSLAAKASTSDVTNLSTKVDRLSFFPKGTILMFNSTDYASSMDTNVWKVCNGQDGTPNLVNRFIRGGTAAGNGTGCADSQSITLQTKHMPKHNHTFTGTAATGSISGIVRGWRDAITASSGVLSVTNVTTFASNRQTPEAADGGVDINFYLIPSGTISETGGGSAASGYGEAFPVTTLPNYYAVIFIIKVA